MNPAGIQCAQLCGCREVIYQFCVVPLNYKIWTHKATAPRVTWEWIGGVIGNWAIQLLLDSRSSVNVNSPCCQAPLMPLCTLLSEAVTKKVTSPLTENQFQSYRSPHGILSFFLRSVLHGDKEKARTFSTMCEIRWLFCHALSLEQNSWAYFRYAHTVLSVLSKQFHFGLETLDKGSQGGATETVWENLRFSRNKMNSQIIKEEKFIMTCQGCLAI